MATITATLAPAHGSSSRGRQAYMVEQTIDLTANSIAPGDVVQALTVPANTKIITAGIQVTASATQNTGTDATATLGTAVDADEYVAAFDIDGAADGAYAPSAAVSGGSFRYRHFFVLVGTIQIRPRLFFPYLFF